MSAMCEPNLEVSATSSELRSVRVDMFDRRQEDKCGCQGQCWLVKHSPSLLNTYSNEQLLSVVKCNQLYQIQRGVLEAETA